jgi:protein tyrosine phosphatase (PTP) superfamily phosphohydrolase (DUF442 family)
MPESDFAVEPKTNGANAPGRTSRFRLGTLLKCIVLATLVMFLAEVLRIFAGSNYACVVPGRCYRSAQPTAQSLEAAKRAYGIRTIVNLRAENEGDAWYQEEKKATQDLGLILVNAGLSSYEQPPAEDFALFVQAMKDAQEPILIHCANGNDRSGLASAVFLLMRTDTSFADARGQLSLRYGHFAFTRASCLQRILDGYEAWLNANAWEHTGDRFFHWGTQVFRPETPR